MTPSGPIAPSPRRAAPVIGRFAPFAGLGETDLAALQDACLPRNWRAGETIFQRGDAGDYLLAVTAGRIRLSLITAQGRELVLRHVAADDIIGEMALLDGGPRSADATAVGDTSALMLRRDAFDRVSRSHPDVMRAIARYLSERLRDTNDQLESIALYDLQTRVARFFVFTLRTQKGGAALADPATLRLDLSQGDLAALLGASRPKVNRALQDLASLGAVRRIEGGFECHLSVLLPLADQELADGP